MRSFLTTLVLFAAVAALRPAPARGQSILDLLQSIRTGGGWVEIPIRGGHGSLTTRPLPTAGLTLEGCMQVYAGLTGDWDIHARDALGGGKLDVHVAPGESRTFAYRTGARGQLTVDARWSEKRDTTLLVWVGLQTPLRPGRDACAPEYGDAGAGEADAAVSPGVTSMTRAPSSPSRLSRR